jgi:hypothetical protein
MAEIGFIYALVLYVDLSQLKSLGIVGNLLKIRFLGLEPTLTLDADRGVMNE